MSTVDRSFIGTGSIHIQPHDQSAPLLPIGNVSEFTFSFEEDRKELKNYLGGGGNRNVISRVSGITASVVAHDFTASNISLALRGTVNQGSTTAITDEPLVSHGVANELIPFKRLPDLNQSITVKDSLDTTLIAGDDYELTQSGIKVIDGGGIDNQGVKVSYTPLSTNMVQALVESGREFVLFMEGLNDAQEGLPFNIRVHRVKFSPVQNLGFISDDFANDRLLSSFQKQTAAVRDAGRAFREAEEKVERLAREYQQADNPTKTLQRRLESARKTVIAANQSYHSQRQEAVKNITSALRISEQIYNERLRQANNEKSKALQESKVSTSAPATRTVQQSPQKIIRLEYPGGAVNVGIDSTDETKLLEALKNAGMRTV